MEGVDNEIYPDIVSMGGLVSAMETVARRARLDLGGVTSQYASGPGLFATAEVNSSRGKISVSLGRSRSFYLGIHQPGITWAEGGIEDLGSLVAAVADWQAGIAVDAFAERFPFMTLGRLARSLDVGDPIAAQWDSLRQAEEFGAAERQLIDSVYADGRLRGLFPKLSHGTLRLSTDRFGAQGAREIHIGRLADGSYCVEDTAASRAKFLGSLQEALVEAAESLSGS
ncbi:DUF6193 family natural product biosynthesis protein [Streptomyces sp. NBC_01520]|uniref:DUF6193 family natural product biosynthesis protein n=1 Tax=Streptomyces sp. NBC_01520 TaxID=2903892 RepID=UPI00386432A5